MKNYIFNFVPEPGKSPKEGNYIPVNKYRNIRKTEISVIFNVSKVGCKNNLTPFTATNINILSEKARVQDNSLDNSLLIALLFFINNDRSLVCAFSTVFYPCLSCFYSSFLTEFCWLLPAVVLLYICPPMSKWLSIDSMVYSNWSSYSCMPNVALFCRTSLCFSLSAWHSPT